MSTQKGPSRHKRTRVTQQSQAGNGKRGDVIVEIEESVEHQFVAWRTDITREATEKYVSKAHRELFHFKHALNELRSLLPQTLANVMSGHEAPLIFANIEISEAIDLAYSGFYRYAFIALRSVLEYGMMSVYYNRNDVGNEAVQGWLRGGKDGEKTPTIRVMRDRLRADVPYIRVFDDEFQILHEAQQTYDILNDHVHGKGYRASSFGTLGLASMNVIGLNTERFEEWLLTYKQVVRIVAALHILKYPLALKRIPFDQKSSCYPAVGFIIGNRRRIGMIFEPPQKARLRDICDHDPYVRIFTAYTKSLPDLTKSELRSETRKGGRWFPPEWSRWHKWLEEHLTVVGRVSGISESEKDHLARRVVREYLEKYHPQRLIPSDYWPRPSKKYPYSNFTNETGLI
jgi:hypothetical protein